MTLHVIGQNEATDQNKKPSYLETTRLTHER